MSALSVIVINSGSSSIKFSLFEGERSRESGAITEIGGASQFRFGPDTAPVNAGTHAAALALILQRLETVGVDISSLGAAAHRVVHGGDVFTEPTHISPQKIALLRSLNHLAPLHNPHNLAAIEALSEQFPDLPQYAVFDTGFHATMPERHRRYAIPDNDVTAGIRRYGFHGISYSSIVHSLSAHGKLPSRLLALHLGNGASLCAIENGRSLATSMGYSPLEGVAMGTRSGSIDGNAVLELARRIGISETATLLNHQSGLRGLAGVSDMRELRADASDQARFAIEYFTTRLVCESGAMIAAMGGVDAIVFTGGIGENDPETRKAVLEGLAFLGIRIDPKANATNAPVLTAADSEVIAYCVPTQEEKMIATAAASLLQNATQHSDK